MFADTAPSFLGPLLSRLGYIDSTAERRAKSPLPSCQTPSGSADREAPAGGSDDTGSKKDDVLDIPLPVMKEEEEEVSVPFAVRIAEAERRMTEQLEVHRQLNACLRGIDDIGRQVTYSKALKRTEAQAWTMQAAVSVSHPAARRVLPMDSDLLEQAQLEQHHHHHHHHHVDPTQNAIRQHDPNIPPSRKGTAAPTPTGVTIVKAYLEEPVPYARRTVVRRAPVAAGQQAAAGGSTVARSVSIAPSPKVTTYERGESDSPGVVRLSTQTRSSLRRSSESAATQEVEESGELQNYRAFSRSSIQDEGIVDDTQSTTLSRQPSASLDRRSSSNVRISYVSRTAPRTSISSPTASSNTVSSDASTLLDETEEGVLTNRGDSESLRRSRSKSELDNLPSDWQSLVGIMRQICSQAADQLLLLPATKTQSAAVDRRTIEKRIARATLVAQPSESGGGGGGGESDPDNIRDVKNLKRFIRAMKTELVALEQRRIAAAKKKSLLKAAAKLAVARDMMQRDKARRLDEVIDEVDEVFDERGGKKDDRHRDDDGDDIISEDMALAGDGSPRPRHARRGGDPYAVDEDDDVIADPFDEVDGEVEDEIPDEFGAEMLNEDGGDDDDGGGHVLDELASRYHLLEEEQEFAGYLANAVMGSAADQGVAAAPHGFVHVSKVIRYGKHGKKEERLPAGEQQLDRRDGRARSSSSSSSSVASFVSSVAEEESLLKDSAGKSRVAPVAQAKGKKMETNATSATAQPPRRLGSGSDGEGGSIASEVAEGVAIESSSESSVFFDPARHKQKLIRRQADALAARKAASKAIMGGTASSSRAQGGQAITFVHSDDAGSVSTNMSLKQSMAEQGLSRRTRSGLLMGLGGGGERQRPANAGSLFDLVRARSFAASNNPPSDPQTMGRRQSTVSIRSRTGLECEEILSSHASSSAFSSDGSDADASGAAPASTTWYTSSSSSGDEVGGSTLTGTSSAESRERRLAKRRHAALRSIAPLTTFSALYDPCESTPSVDDSEDEAMMFRLPDRDLVPAPTDEISPISAESPAVAMTSKKQPPGDKFFYHPEALAQPAGAAKKYGGVDSASSSSSAASSPSNTPRDVAATPPPGATGAGGAGAVGGSISHAAHLSGSALGQFWGIEPRASPDDAVRLTGDGPQAPSPRFPSAAVDAAERDGPPPSGRYEVDDLVAMADWKRRQSQVISSLASIGDSSKAAIEQGLSSARAGEEADAAAHHWAILDTMLRQRFGAELRSFSSSSLDSSSTSSRDSSSSSSSDDVAGDDSAGGRYAETDDEDELAMQGEQ